MTERLAVSTPGRLCLFGEHQDYLSLPVIPAAISLRLTITGSRTNDAGFVIHMPDVNDIEQFSPVPPIQYSHSKDYLRSAVVVLNRHGFSFSHGIECTIRSDIPIRAGTSSSSALTVAWVDFLARLSDQQHALPPAELARYAYEAEVVEFHEAGGIMDQCAAAFGGVLFIDFLPSFRVEQLQPQLGAFVLGDSREPKDTQAILHRVKSGMLDVVHHLRRRHPDFSLEHLTRDSAAHYRLLLTSEQWSLLEGTLHNYELTKTARSLLGDSPLDHKRLGRLMTEHHGVLRDVLKISTPRIEQMLDAALDAGAYGGKINGSGGGGCMFAYAPENTEQIADAIERSGGRAYIVHVDNGSKHEIPQEVPEA